MSKKRKKILDKWFGIGKKKRGPIRAAPEYEDEADFYEEGEYDEDDYYYDEDDCRELPIADRLKKLNSDIAPGEPPEEDYSVWTKKLADKVGYTPPVGATMLDQLDGLEQYYYGSKETDKANRQAAIDTDLVFKMAKQMGLRTVLGDAAGKVLEGVERALNMDVDVQRRKPFKVRVVEARTKIYG